MGGGEGGSAGPPPSSYGPPVVPLWSPAEGGPKILKLKSAEAKFWLSAPNIGRGGDGGVQGGLLLRLSAVLIHPWGPLPPPPPPTCRPRDLEQ